MRPLFEQFRPADIAEGAAKLPDSDKWMPALLRQLILGSGAPVESCRFLTYERTNLSGWDGVVISDDSGLYVPEGVSGWELSKRKSVLKKANEDITERSNHPGELIVEKSTYVAVTLRDWPGRKLESGSRQDSGAHKAAWASEMKQAHRWKAVKVLDAEDIAAWLAAAPGVGLWFAQLLGRQVKGATSLVTVWDDLSTLRGGLTLTPKVFLAGREKFTEALDEWFTRDPCPFEARTSAYDDLRDTIAAWWETRAEEDRLSSTSPIAVRTKDAWDSLIRTSEPLLLLVDDGLELAPEHMSAATTRGHYLIHRTTAHHSRGASAPLPHLRREQLAEELRLCGIEHEDAWRIAGDAGGSGLALKRLLHGSSAQPDWADSESARRLAPIVLVGTWDGNSDADRSCVAEVFGQPYENVEKLLERWSDGNDPLVRRHGQQWRVVSREDAWRFLTASLNPGDFNRYRDVAVSVLGELDPCYDMPPDERMFAAVQDQAPAHSHRLHRAIGETLCLLTLRSPSQGLGIPTEIARTVVSTVLAGAADWRLWASLDLSLVYISEAAPDLFLEALEDDLKRENPATAEIFAQGSDSGFGNHPHVDLMWALEALLWEKEFVLRSLIALANLAALDPGGNMGPRPEGVLREAFLPWLPQCCLNIDERCSVLDKIAEAEPRVAWSLFFGLLPRNHDVSSPNYTPKYRAKQPPPGNEVSNVDYWKQVSHVAHRLVQDADNKLDRWEQLVGELGVLPRKVFEIVLNESNSIGDTLEERERFRLWDALRGLVAEHRYFAIAKWAMPSERLEAVEKVAASLEPEDPVLRNIWLFRGSSVYLPETNSEMPRDEKNRLVEAAQLACLKELIGSGGLDQVQRLAGKLEAMNSGQLGAFAARSGIVFADAEILPKWLEDTNDGIAAFARGYSRQRFTNGGWTWFSALRSESWNPESFADVARQLPFCGVTWEKIDLLGADHIDAYWENIWPWMGDATAENAKRAVEEFTSRHRSDAALECVDSALYHQLAMPTKLPLMVLESNRSHLIRKAGETGSIDPLPNETAHSIGKIFKHAQESIDRTAEQSKALEELEWFFLPLLKHFGAPCLLLSRAGRDPEFFLELIEASKQPDDQPADQASEPTVQQQNMATLSNELLKSIRKLPGVDNDGALQEEELKLWVAEMRRLAAERGYTKVCEWEFGKLMLHSPTDSAGYWPCAPVCRILSDISSNDFHDGLSHAIFNNQGWPGPFASGESMTLVSEKHKAIEKLRELAEKLDLEFPIVANLLRQIAEKRERVEQIGHAHDFD